MPLTLVTGPANAEKARVVLGRLREEIAAGTAPLLVVPTFDDVRRYRLELAGTEVVFGAQVVRPVWLIDQIARRTGVRGRPLGRVSRERVAAAVIAAARLGPLRASAATPGFPRALLRLVDELEEARVEPQRLTQALRAWAGEDGGRRAHADDVAALYAGYRRALERLGRRDAPLHGAAALAALAAEPARWGATPVLFYGFDDLTPLQADAVVTLARAGAPVTVSLPFEPGRLAFAGRATTVAVLEPEVDQRIALEARAEHYAPASRAALHHLERRLFEPATGPAALFDPERIEAGEAVALLEGGGERAELELVAARAAQLVAGEGYAPEEIAVVHRAPRTIAPLAAQVFAAAGVPLAVARRVRFGHAPLGRGLVALLRCAVLDGSADDLLAWLRSPGLVRVGDLVDALEADVRKDGARTAARARELWEGAHPGWTLDALDRVARAASRGPAALLERLGVELALLFAAPHGRTAPLLSAPEAVEARVLAAGRRALGELGALADADARLAPAAAELAATLDELELPVEGPSAGAVALADPLSIRARRVRALFLCGLQEGVFPAPARPEPFFGDDERGEIAVASGLRLRRNDDPLGAERHLLYATVSRPEERLVLSWHAATDDGDPAVRSLFVADVCDLFAPSLQSGRALRGLGAAGGTGPAGRDALRAAAASAPRRREAPLGALSEDGVLRGLRERATWSASALETWAGCPVRWLVERHLRPEGLDADPELMVRGSVAHAALEATLRTLAQDRGDARLHPGSLPAARRLLLAELPGLLRRRPLSPDPRRHRALARALEADLVRYLERAAAAGSALTPEGFELRFGADGDPYGPLRIAGDVALAGRIDRLDRSPGGDAVVYDYKGATAYPHPRWRRDRRFQLALYLLAARELLGLRPAGGLYQPLAGADPQPRGALRDDADTERTDVKANDRVSAEQLDDLLAGVVQDALVAVAELRAGALEPRPPTCGWRDGGCTYPTICRSEATA